MMLQNHAGSDFGMNGDNQQLVQKNLTIPYNQILNAKAANERDGYY